MIQPKELLDELRPYLGWSQAQLEVAIIHANFLIRKANERVAEDEDDLAGLLLGVASANVLAKIDLEIALRN